MPNRMLLKEPCNVYNFKQHVATCSRHVDPPGQSLLKWVRPREDSSQPARALAKPTFFCPGLTEKDDSRIPHYIAWKQSYFGGGGQSELAVADHLFPNKAWSKLSDSQKKEVHVAQQLTWKWVIDISNGLVRSTSCERTVARQDGSLLPSLPRCPPSHLFQDSSQC